MATRIVVIGAGYAGTVAAKRAALSGNARVTLVNAADRFTERVRLHQVAAGQRLRDTPLRNLLDGTGIELVVDRVTAVDPSTRIVCLAESAALEYDVLIYALGSRSDMRSVPGVAERAYTVAESDNAQRLQARIENGGVVAVVGGGLTGIETATELAESRPELKVRLVTSGQLGSTLGARARRHLHRSSRRFGIEVQEYVPVAEVRQGGLLLADGSHLAADTVVWTTGFTVSPLARDAGFAVDEAGRLLADGHGRSISHADVYGVGDAASLRRPDGQELRMACATGMPTAFQIGAGVAARLAGRRPRPLRFRYYFPCISLGRRDALIQFVRGDDRPVPAVLTGRLGAMWKEAIVRGALRSQRKPGLIRLFS